ncbi:MAG TPA: hypothetical protein VJR06_03765, partial [Nitrososphaerales archaeon]|nr:hypothetical protein [Nitrososphaerales archaeon]
AYAILNSPYYTSAFHDIASGSNGFSAGPGWDPATGVGSPNIGNLVTCTQGLGGVKCAGQPTAGAGRVSITSPAPGQTVTAQTLTVAGTHSIPPGNFQTGLANSASGYSGSQVPSLDILQAWFSDYRTLSSGQTAINLNFRIQDLTNLMTPATGTLGNSWRATWAFGGATDYAEMLLWYTNQVGITAAGTGVVGVSFVAGTIFPNNTISEFTLNGTYTATAPGLITFTIPTSDVGSPTAGSALTSVTAFCQQYIGTPRGWLQFTVSQVLTPSTYTYNVGDLLRPAGYVQVALDPSFTGAVTANLGNFPGSNQWSATMNLTGLPSGEYTLYARQVVNGIPGIPAYAPFNLVSPTAAQGTL